MTQPPALPRASVAPTSLALFGPPPLLEGENAAAYDELLARVSGAMKPTDIFEQIWVRDVVDLAWETFRLRRLKSSLLAANAPKGLRAILQTFTWRSNPEKLVQGWAARDPAAIKTVDDGLASTGLTMDAVIAQTLSVKIDDIERIDRMIMTAEARRNAVLREVDRHRARIWRRRSVGRAKRSRTRSSRWSNQPKSPIAAWRDQRTQAARQSRQCPRQHWSADGRRQGARDT